MILHHIAVKIIYAKIIDVLLKEQKIINYHIELLNMIGSFGIKKDTDANFIDMLKNKF